MTIKINLFILMLMLSVSACDNEPAKSKIENPLAGHAKALEKAKQVEEQLLEAQKKTEEAIEKATQ